MSDVIVEAWRTARTMQVSAEDGNEYKLEIRQNAMSGRFDVRCWALEDGQWKIRYDFPYVDEGSIDDAWKVGSVKLGEIV